MTALTELFGALRWPGWITWLRHELAPFPGRSITTLRLVVVVAMVTVISLTLQVPQLPLSAFYVFFVTKENRALTTVTGVVMLIASTVATAITLCLCRFTFDYPELRVPVLAGLIFTGMFLSRVLTMGPIGFVIGFFSALMLTISESAPNTESLVRGLLWLWVALSYPIVLTIIVNHILLPAHPWDGVVRGLTNRLDAAAAALRRMLDTGIAGGRPNTRLLELATRGSSGLCAALKFAESDDPVLQRRHGSLMATIAAGEDLASATAALEFRPEIAITEDDRLCAETLLIEITRLQNAVPKRDLVIATDNSITTPASIPHLRDVQFAVKCFHHSLVGGNPANEGAPAKPARKPLLVADAFTNPLHTRFALKVTLAAMICYFVYNGLGWPGISTSFVTCCFIALGSTGATMRKGWLRILGCSAGGLLGFLCIMFLIPRMESIVPLLLLTILGTALTGWVAVGSDRFSYAGLQAAFAFYMSIFQGFTPETNFTTVRDRVAGILLGIVVSSVVFHHIWPERAIDDLRTTLARVLRQLAKLIRLPAGGQPGAAAKDLAKIRGEVTRGFDSTLALSEVMIFESRQSDLQAVFTPARLENMVAGSQAASLMMFALLGTAKSEEWQRLNPAVQQAEAALRTAAGEFLRQIAAHLEKGPVPEAAAFESAFREWSRAVATVTGNDRPRLVRRVVHEIQELA